MNTARKRRRQVIKILEATREQLTTKTWVAHAPSTANGETCLLVALDRAALDMAGDYGDFFHAGQVPIQDCLAERDPLWTSISYWNDQRADGVDEVIEVVDCAIARAGDKHASK